MKYRVYSFLWDVWLNSFSFTYELDPVTGTADNGKFYSQPLGRLLNVLAAHNWNWE